MEEKIKKLNEAKDNVRWLLEHSGGLVNMKGISYWAGVVERLREEINKEL